MRSPAAVTYKEGAQPQRIYAFVMGDNRRLYVNYWDGSQWRWRDQGVPPGPIVSFGFGIQAITYKDLNQPQRIYAFVSGVTTSSFPGSHLYVNYWDGSQWRWADQGAPPGGTVGSISGAVTFQDTYYDSGAEPRQIYVYVGRRAAEYEEGIDRYFVNHWNGYQWLWEETGPEFEQFP